MMNNDLAYMQAINQAQANLTDLEERGMDALGDDAIEFMQNLLTPEEIAASNLRIAIMGELLKARQDKNISQRELEFLSGVKQPIISRMESGTTSPQLDTVLKVLGALGKTLYIGDISESKISAVG